MVTGIGNGMMAGSRLRASNLGAVYGAIREHRPVSRAQLSRLLGTSKPTVARALDDLLAAGLVRPVAAGADVKSYGAVLFEPVAGAAVVLVLDLSGRQLRGELVDLDGTRLARADRPRSTPVLGGSPADVVASTEALRAELLRAAKVRPSYLAMAVVAVTGADDSLAARIRAAVGVRVHVEHAVHLAALGEQRRGAGMGVDEFVLLSVGHEVRAGIVLGGRLYRGGNGAAGAIDHAPGGRGFSTDSPAADAFLASAEQRVRLAGAATSLRTPLRVEKVLAAARTGDRLAGELVAGEARRIARYAARLAGVLDPELIVLGGGIGANGDLLLDPVRRSLAGLVPFPPTVVNSRLGDSAALVGGATLGAETVLRGLLVAAGGSPSQ